MEFIAVIVGLFVLFRLNIPEKIESSSEAVKKVFSKPIEFNDIFLKVPIKVPDEDDLNRHTYKDIVILIGTKIQANQQHLQVTAISKDHQKLKVVDIRANTEDQQEFIIDASEVESKTRSTFCIKK